MTPPITKTKLSKHRTPRKHPNTQQAYTPPHRRQKELSTPNSTSSILVAQTPCQSRLEPSCGEARIPLRIQGLSQSTYLGDETSRVGEPRWDTAEEVWVVKVHFEHINELLEWFCEVCSWHNDRNAAQTTLTGAGPLRVAFPASLSKHQRSEVHTLAERFQPLTSNSSGVGVLRHICVSHAGPSFIATSSTPSVHIHQPPPTYMKSQQTSTRCKQLWEWAQEDGQWDISLLEIEEMLQTDTLADTLSNLIHKKDGVRRLCDTITNTTPDDICDTFLITSTAFLSPSISLVSVLFAKDPDGRRPLHVAARLGRLAIVKSILKTAPNVIDLKAHGKTSLQTARRAQQHTVVAYLLQKAAFDPSDVKR